MCSPLSQILRVVQLARGGRKGSVAVLACYLDDSDAEMSKVMTVAGYVADQEEWEKIEFKLEAICQEFQVDVIHGIEISSRGGCFKGWSQIKITGFLLSIGEAMSEHIAFGISRSMDKRYYQARKRALNVNPNIGAYGYLFGSVATALRQEDNGLSQRVIDEGIAFLLEEHKGNPGCLDYVEIERKHGNMHPSTTVTSISKTSCRAIQAADLYAIHARRAANRFARTQGKLAFFPDLVFDPIKRRLTHFDAYIEEPYRAMINTDTGEQIGFALNIPTPVTGN